MTDHTDRTDETAGTDDAPSLLAGRYLLGAELGRGGMAVVHRAWDSVLNRDVAVKMMHALLLDAGARERFDQERATLAGLNHPGLIMIFDAGTQDRRPYLVMELVVGVTLDAHYRRHWLEPAEVARIGAALADALTYVHGCGVVHRDVKPSNVLIGADGRVRLADFGIARLLANALRQTAAGLTMGTAGYLAPEQVRGEPATTASDVYALGLTLLEALSGRPVYTGPPDVAALARLIRPPDVDDALPPALRTLLRAMTADQPTDRPTAGQVVTGLRAAGAELRPTPDHLPPSPLPFPLPSPFPLPLPSPFEIQDSVTAPVSTPAPVLAGLAPDTPAGAGATARSGHRRAGWGVAAAVALLLVAVPVIGWRGHAGDRRPVPTAAAPSSAAGRSAATAGRPATTPLSGPATSGARPGDGVSGTDLGAAGPSPGPPLPARAITPATAGTPLVVVVAGNDAAKGKAKAKGKGHDKGGTPGQGPKK